MEIPTRSRESETERREGERARNFRQSDFLRAISGSGNGSGRGSGGRSGGNGDGGGGSDEFVTLRDLPLVAPGRYVADDIENRAARDA